VHNRVMAENDHGLLTYSGDHMGISKQRRSPADTQEFLVMWSETKERHFVQRLAPLLAQLLGSTGALDEKRTEETARHLVRALHLAATPEGGLAAAMDYLGSVGAAEGSAT
jgi:hypothetical protein